MHDGRRRRFDQELSNRKAVGQDHQHKHQHVPEAKPIERGRDAVERVKDLSEQEAMDEVYKAFRFDLCRTCQKAYIRAPLGPSRPA